MLAYRLISPRNPPRLMEVQDPVAEAGEVIVKVAACGLCHTDFAVIDKPDWGDTPPPFTLGHEIAGYVSSIGPGVRGLRVGQAVCVMPGWSSCGRCHPCRRGEENHCIRLDGIKSAGLGYDGGLATYIRVPGPSFLVAIPDGLDPVEAAPLTDAGLTTYTAIKPALRDLYPGATAVVIGIGGLGLMAVQFLRQLSTARIIAIDSSEQRLELATQYGATHALVSGPGHSGEVRSLTGGMGAQFVLDCVGTEGTLKAGIGSLARGGRLTLVGASGGKCDFGFFQVPAGAQLTTSLNGGSLALKEVLDLAASGRVKALVDRYSLQDVDKGYDDLKHGRLTGRAVVIPE